MQPARPYIERAIDGVLDELLAELPAIQLVGPRAVGKTTTAQHRVASVVHLDRPGQAIAFRADPDAVLAALDEPVLLDEWQAVPEVLAAVKRAVDVDPRPGRFLITGSVRARLDAPTWAGAGRVVNMTMRPLIERELIGRATASSFFERVVSGDVGHPVPGTPDLVGYLELVVRGGFPGVVALGDGAGRRRWLRATSPRSSIETPSWWTAGGTPIGWLATCRRWRSTPQGLSTTSASTMAKHLRWLRDQLGDRFVRGVLLHTGPAAFELDDRILALPIAAIWI